MASTEVKAVTYSCDNPKCGNEHTVSRGDIPRGIVIYVDVPGEDGAVEVYACGRTHVGAAVLAVYDVFASKPEPEQAEEKTAEPEPELLTSGTFSSPSN